MFDEPTNEDRASWGLASIRFLGEQTWLVRAGEPREVMLTDLLCYLMRAAVHADLNFAAILGDATASFWTDLEDAGDPVPAWSTGEADFAKAVTERATNLLNLNIASLDTKEHERDLYEAGIAAGAVSVKS